MSAAESAVKPESDKEETSESEASGADPKPSSVAAAAAPINKQKEAGQPIAKPAAPIAKPMQPKQAVIEEKITRVAAQISGLREDTQPRKMKRAQKTRQVELEPPADLDNGEEPEEQEEAEEYEEGEPSQAAIAIMNGAKKALAFTRCLVSCFLRLLCCSVRAVVSLLPTSLHLAIFLSLLYSLAEYVVTPLPSYVDFVGRLRYVVRCLAWTLVPAVLGYIVSGWKKAEGHKKFADDTFRLVAMLGLNSAVFATYASAQCMHYVWVLHVLVTFYSLCYWASLIYGGAFTRKSFRQPTVAILFLFMAWNFWNIFSQDLGWDDPQTPSPAPPASSGDRGLYYWQHATMCEMVERVFCTTEDGPRMFYL